MTQIDWYHCPTCDAEADAATACEVKRARRDDEGDTAFLVQVVVRCRRCDTVLDVADGWVEPGRMAW